MNIIVHVPGVGPMHFGPDAARAAAAFLTDRLARIPDTEQPAYLKAVRELEHAANPEAHFDISHYAMPGAKAGWER